jgi:large subunit ribosomal protein L17
MRHRKSGRKLGMDGSARKAMFRNMVTSLLVHQQIRTTEAKAKELRRFAERVISLGKRAPSAADIAGLKGEALKTAQAKRVHAIRRARRWVNNDEAMGRLFGEYAERYTSRPGGYTRIIKMGRRPGDNAPMAIIALVQDEEVSEETAVSEESETVEEQEAAPEVEASEEEAVDGDDEVEADTESDESEE